MKRRLTLAAFCLSFVASLFLLVAPAYSGYRKATLLAVNGPWVLVPLAFPMAVTLAPLLWARQAVWIAASVVIWAFCLIAGFSIGLFYIPSAAVLLIAACVELRGRMASQT